MTKKNSTEGPAPRKRSLTSMTLSWLAERMRRTERVKDALDKGQYHISSEEIARRIATKVS